jgi:hypothetical protein
MDPLLDPVTSKRHPITKKMTYNLDSKSISLHYENDKIFILLKVVLRKIPLLGYLQYSHWPYLLQAKPVDVLAEE